VPGSEGLGDLVLGGFEGIPPVVPPDPGEAFCFEGTATGDGSTVYHTFTVPAHSGTELIVTPGHSYLVEWTYAGDPFPSYDATGPTFAIHTCAGYEFCEDGDWWFDGPATGTETLYSAAGASGDPPETPWSGSEVVRFPPDPDDDASYPGTGRMGLIATSSLGANDGDWSVCVTDLTGDPGTIIASFVVDPDPITYIATITDTSSGEVDTWLWDFGDGSTASTDPGPFAHEYPGPGTYTVILTITGPAGSDSYSVTFTIEDVAAPPSDPGAAIVEIYIPAPGGDRWVGSGDSRWGTATWSGGGWVDISPWCVAVEWTWGADRSSAGILADVSAGWAQVDTFSEDDERSPLDPANTSSPFYPHIAGGTPIRLRHPVAGVIRTGVIDKARYSVAEHSGVINAVDDVSLMRRAEVPAGTTLADDLYGLVADALAASGLAYPLVESPTSYGSPTITLIDTTNAITVWDAIAQACRELLWIPWLDEDRVLHLRPYGAPYPRGRSLSLGLMTDLVTLIEDDDLYSVVRVLDPDEVTIEERAVTPTPAYGKRVHERLIPTIDPGDWADAVLADRGERRPRRRPGRLVPESGGAVAFLAGITPVERIDVIDPDLPTTQVIVLGARVNVTALREGRWFWRWYLQTAPVTEE
jgi:PKD repeat protein